ncbi:hypothetical protein MKZ38_006354 [Zalerion maritima]|uniref:Nitrogen permease regulator 3 n=1 Tax=Zalerion maritima TaxID=339359 RepID=A0AAD5S3J0_9PEZI|nr:hypothetical protein MKZ38_006354 [Zalerion maritima]
MASPILPNTSNFLAVALVISRSRDGPRFVFHYPPHVLPVHSNPETLDEDYDDDDILVERASRATTEDGHNIASEVDMHSRNHEDHFITETGTQYVPWEHVAGFPTNHLENVLTPGRSFHKSQFQVSLDPIYCVSYPIYVPESGIWKKKKKQAKKPSRPDEDEPGNGKAVTPSDVAHHDNGETASAHKPGPPAEEKKSSMNMFNLVFFLNPKKHEARELISIMFQNIIKKVNKAYKYSQQRCDFVWKESKKILQLKDKGVAEKTKMSALWEEILTESSLAASMQEIYEAISQHKIAALTLDMPEGPPINHSVQIPRPFYVEDIPENPTDVAIKGLWITTANTFGGEEDYEDPIFIAKNFALLLMDDDKKIIAELQADASQVDRDTMKMVKFVQLSKPTLSQVMELQRMFHKNSMLTHGALRFHQVAQNNVLTLGDVREFTRHFIYWRRAIAIPPLHARDVYILSPNCDISRLPKACDDWKRKFNPVPSLTSFLAEMSYAPRMYKYFCPSKSLRPQYLEMLAWLMRGGWVTQLCTFAYVVVWPEIIYEVEYALEAQAIKGPPEQTKRTTSSSESPSNTSSQVASDTEGDMDEASSTADTAIQRSTEDISRSHLSILSSPSQDSPDISDHQASLLAQTTTPTSPGLPKRTFGSAASLSNTSGSNRTRHHHLHHPHHHVHHSHSQTHSNTPPTTEQVAEQARLNRIADRKARDAAEKAAAHARRIPPRPTAHPSTNQSPHLAGIEPYIILDAKKSTGKESLFLAAIRKRLEGGRDMIEARLRETDAAMLGNIGAAPSTPVQATTSPVTSGATTTGQTQHTAGGRAGVSLSQADNRKVAEAWERFLRYFNGRFALERVALMEDMKRKEAWNLMTAMSEHLLTVRHW